MTRCKRNEVYSVIFYENGAGRQKMDPLFAHDAELYQAVILDQIRGYMKIYNVSMREAFDALWIHASTHDESTVTVKREEA